MSERKGVRNLWMTILAGLIFAAFVPAVEKEADLNGTWVLDPARSDSQMRRSGRAGEIPGMGGGYPGTIGLPGIIGFPGSTYPGTGYPSGRRAGRYPGDGGDDPEERMPREEMKNLSLQIVRKDDELQTTRTFSINGEDRTINQKFSLDGSEDTNPASNGRGEFVSRSTWKKGKLINSGTQTSNAAGRNNDVSITEEYSLSKDGKTLTIKTTQTGLRGEMSFRQVFNKQ